MQFNAYTYGGNCRGNTGRLDEDLTVRDTGQLIRRGDISLVSRRGGSRLLGMGLGLWPLFARHSRLVMRRFLQATRNRS